MLPSRETDPLGEHVRCGHSNGPVKGCRHVLIKCTDCGGLRVPVERIDCGIF